jgi:hypothetical protein
VQPQARSVNKRASGGESPVEASPSASANTSSTNLPVNKRSQSIGSGINNSTTVGKEASTVVEKKERKKQRPLSMMAAGKATFPAETPSRDASTASNGVATDPVVGSDDRLRSSPIARSTTASTTTSTTVDEHGMHSDKEDDDDKASAIDDDDDQAGSSVSADDGSSVASSPARNAVASGATAVIKEGWLERKKTGIRTNWERRYYAVAASGVLSERVVPSAPSRAAFHLGLARIAALPSAKKPATFHVQARDVATGALFDVMMRVPDAAAGAENEW